MMDFSPRASRASGLRFLLRGIAVGAFMAAAWFTYDRLVLMPQRGSRARTAIGGIQMIGNELVEAINGGLPVPGSVAEIIAQAKARLSSEMMIGKAETDPWGSPYFFEVVSDRKYCGDECLKVVVRSFGPNRRDDLGRPDDIQGIYAAWPSRAEQRNKPADAARQP